MFATGADDAQTLTIDSNLTFCDIQDIPASLSILDWQNHRTSAASMESSASKTSDWLASRAEKCSCYAS